MFKRAGRTVLATSRSQPLFGLYTKNGPTGAALRRSAHVQATFIAGRRHHLVWTGARGLAPAPGLAAAVISLLGNPRRLTPAARVAGIDPVLFS